MASRFWVGGTGTWDASTTTNWSATSGGAGGASAPTTGDDVTFNASSGGGTVTVDSTVNGLSLLSLTAGAFTGTLDFSVNNPSMTFTGSSPSMNLSGTGARKYLLGSGTFTFTNTGISFDIGTTTNLDPTSVLTAALVFNATTSISYGLNGGGRTLGSVTIQSNTSRGPFRIFGANTYSSLNLAAGASVLFPSGTSTISNAVTWTGTSSNPILIQRDDPNSGAATISFSSGSSTLDWGGVHDITTTGSGTFVATNSLNFGRVTFDSGDSSTAPSGGGGGGGQRTIGG